MLTTKESIEFFDNLRKSLSIRRFQGYTHRGSDLDGFAKYLWNIRLCEALCPCFQILEVSFRNRTHALIGTACKQSNWISTGIQFLHADEQQAIIEAKETLARSSSPLTEDYLVAEMKFGFWTGLLNSRYEILWRKVIADVFPHMPKTMRTRDEASAMMNSVRRLRNEALHHHSIWHWRDLKEKHAQMRKLISYICASSDRIASNLDRFPEIHSAGIGDCQKIAAQLLKSIQSIGE
jgi:glutamine synthetase adenylyltransferase